jgi:hypothetical protein
MERVHIFYHNIPLNSTLAENPRGLVDLPEAYDEWFRKRGKDIEVISRQFSTAGPIPGLDGGHIVMSIAVFYRPKTQPDGNG